MLLAAQREGCLREVLVIVAALAMQDPRERPLERQQAADEKHRRFRDEHSDFLALLKLWEYYHDQARQLSKNQLRNLCQAEFLSFVRLREWHDLHHELLGSPPKWGCGSTSEPAPYPNLHRALLTGLLGHLGFEAGGKCLSRRAGSQFLPVPRFRAVQETAALGERRRNWWKPAACTPAP
jgi:ATP-dependent helicase HrpA